MRTSRMPISFGTAFAAATILSAVVILAAFLLFGMDGPVAPGKTESATADTGGSLSVKDWQLLAKSL